ncbi:hypothetical protein JKP88DRAFT_326424, partial [Tribonema minus]
MNRERQQHTRMSSAQGASPLLGQLSAERNAKSTARGVTSSLSAGHGSSAAPAVADIPLQPVSQGREPVDVVEPPAMPQQDVATYQGRAPSATQPSSAASDSQSPAAAPAGPFIASDDLGLAAEASSSGDNSSACGFAVGTDIINTPRRGPASARSAGGGSVHGFSGLSENHAPPPARAALGTRLEAAQEEFAVEGRNELREFNRRLDHAKWFGEENKTRAKGAERLAELVQEEVYQHVIPHVQQLQQRLEEVAQGAASNAQTATDGIISLTARVDALTACVDGLREARATRFYTPASALQTPAHAELSEHNLRALGGGSAGPSRRAVDVRSLLSSHTVSETLPPRPPALLAAQLPSPARSAMGAPAQALSGRAPPSSLAATVPAHAPLPQPDRYRSMLAEPEPQVALCGAELNLVSQRSGALDVLKPDARAQLDGAARQASQSRTYARAQAQLTQVHLEERTKAQALAAVAQREHDRAQREIAERRQQDMQRHWQEEMDARAALPQGAMDAREHAPDAQQRTLDQAPSQTRADADSDADSYSVASYMRSSHAGGARGGGGGSGGGGGGGGGSGGGGGGGGGDSNADSSGAAGALTGAATPAAAAARVASTKDMSGFDEEGYALMRFSVTLDEKQYVKTKVDTDSVTALTLLKRQLPAKFKAAATALRQKKLWPNLLNADDFGCEWFEQAVYGICNCIATGGGNHRRLAQLQRQALAWVEQGNALAPPKRDGALLEWLFHRIATFLEIEEPTTIAANLMSWSLRGGLSLKDFIIEFADAKTIATSLDPSLDVIVLSALLQLLRRHYPNLSALFNPISEAPGRRTQTSCWQSLPRRLPAGFGSGSGGVGGGGGGAGKQLSSGRPGRDGGAAAALSKEQRVAEQVQQRLRAQTAYAIYEFHTAPWGRACFNCGSPDHGFISGAGERRLSRGDNGACTGGRRLSCGEHSFCGGATCRHVCSSCATTRCDGSSARRRRAARGAFFCCDGAGERRTRSSSATERCGTSGARGTILSAC